jgi:hypothetical protein
MPCDRAGAFDSPAGVTNHAVRYIDGLAHDLGGRTLNFSLDTNHAFCEEKAGRDSLHSLPAMTWGSLSYTLIGRLPHMRSVGL